jgi:hypothetical protein
MANVNCFKVLITLAAVTCAVAIPACGSSSKPSSTTGWTGIGQGVAYADCMRSHGVTGFPDPSPGGGVALPSTISQQSPSYQNALRTCAKLQSGPTSGPPNKLRRLFGDTTVPNRHRPTRQSAPYMAIAQRTRPLACGRGLAG